MSRLLLVFVSAAIAQVTFHGRFWSTLYGKDVLSTKAMHTLDPPMNNQLLMLASFREEEDPGPPKFAEAIEFPVDSKNNGEWLQRDGLWIWRAQVTSPGALSLSLLFDHFELAEGSEFYIKTDTVTKALIKSRNWWARSLPSGTTRMIKNFQSLPSKVTSSSCNTSSPGTPTTKTYLVVASSCTK